MATPNTWDELLLWRYGPKRAEGTFSDGQSQKPESTESPQPADDAIGAATVE